MENYPILWIVYSKEEEVRKEVELKEKKQQEAEQQKLQEQLEKEEALKRQIQQALNEQTYEQFRTYAEQQFPGEPERQGALVRQLQEQHYFQYMQQLQASPKQEPIHDTCLKEEELQQDDQSPCAASMWTRSDIEAFKQSVAQADGDGVVRVGHGETVTVRVPTHREGSRLFWEFATDHYDIGMYNAGARLLAAPGKISFAAIVIKGKTGFLWTIKYK